MSYAQSPCNISILSHALFNHGQISAGVWRTMALLPATLDQNLLSNGQVTFDWQSILMFMLASSSCFFRFALTVSTGHNPRPHSRFQ
jgi:hypothetical protein